MRFHHNLVLATVDTLHQIFNEDQYADKAISRTLKKDKRWGARDRAFIAETTYDIVRYKRLYAAIADVKEPYKKQDLWRMVAVWIVLNGYEVPAWEEFYNTPVRRIKGRFDELSKDLVYRESIPDWLNELGQKELGAKWEKEIAALNKQADVVLRVNSLKGDKSLVAEKLLAEEFATTESPNHPDALILKERGNVFGTSVFKDGFFEVQDAGSQMIASFTDAQPGTRVVDACAGAGGKALHLAAMMENKGQVIALDIYSNKLNELKRRARRAGAHNIETRLIDSTKVIKKLKEKMDVVLIDAPCSGLGVLRRNPDAKWKLKPEFIDEIKVKQAEILHDYSSMVKADGTLVYATCSILPSENNEQVKAFLKSENGKDFSLVEERHLLAHTHGFDGFYMAKMKKNS